MRKSVSPFAVVFDYGDERVIWHGGGDLGAASVALYVPERDIGLVIITNRAEGRALFPLIVERFYDNEDYVGFLRAQAGG